MSHAGPLISVLIPTYNRAYSVGRAIDSVLSQENNSIEVLVVDDGSKDKTRELIHERYGNDPRVRYFYKENGGVSSARNLGIRESRGRFVAFLDSDDWWLPGKLALQLEGLRLVPEAGLIWTDMQAVGARDEVLHSRYLRKMYQAYRFFKTPQDLFSKELSFSTATGEEVKLYAGDIFSQMVLGSLIHTSTVLLRRERLEKAGFFREDYRVGEDYEFYVRACKEGPAAFIDAVTISYKIGMEDALTVHTNNLPIALSFVQTLERTLRESRGRITLPEAQIRDCTASAYAWAGGACLNQGLASRARGYLIKSLKVKPWQPQQLKYLALTFIPRHVMTSLRSLLAQLRGRPR